MKRQLVCAAMIASAALLFSGCKSNDNESAGGQPDNNLRHRVSTSPESSSGLGNTHQTPVPTSEVRPTDEKTKEEYRKLSDGILDENGNPTQQGAGTQQKP